MQLIIDDKNQLKEVFKQAITELRQEGRDLLILSVANIEGGTFSRRRNSKYDAAS